MTPLHSFKRILQRSHRKYLIVVLVSSMVLLGFGMYEVKRTLVILPGTEPGTVAGADDVTICRQCHHSTSASKPVTIYDEWAGSMMAHSARDPIFYAALAVANKYNSVTGQAHGEFCIRCHSPNGWLAGHSEDYTGQSLTGTDFDGVQCDYCHRAVDPLNPDSTVPHLNSQVPGYGNGMHVVQRYSTPKRGPFDSVSAPHGIKYDSFQKTSELCGVCHDVSNPFYAENAALQAPHSYAPLERTYSEWLMSWYATQSDSGTCQACHMETTSGFACILGDSSSLRTNLPTHDLTGGNTFLPDILPDFDTFFNSQSRIDTAALAGGKLRATSMLQRAADLTMSTSRSADSLGVNVRIVNLTGHKLPTGYPDGRRMWLNVVGKSAQGDTLFQSGKYDTASALLIRDDNLKVYEAIHGLTEARSISYGMPPGPSLHFALNDTILFDNRIPPKGFLNIAFQSRYAEPVGVTYADSQHWDDTHFSLPAAVTEVTANLYYQTISKEYVEFLKNENIDNIYDWNNWGARLFSAWETHGKSAPVLMNSKTLQVEPASVENEMDNIAATFELYQNYPNPFNPRTDFGFRIADFSARGGSASGGGFVSLKIFDLYGRQVEALVNERKAPGSYRITFDGSRLSSGIYFYSLEFNGKTQTKKMLLIR